MSNFYDKFQTPPQSLLQSPVPVMSLRDWFAGQALAGLMMKDPWADPLMLASYAFNAADAMLAERTKGETK